MALRSFKKYANLGLDEEKDFFLASLNKKIRNAKKKLDQIDDLAKKDKSTLKAEQLEKIQTRGEVLQGIRSVEDLKEMYFAAYKTAKEEGKVNQATGEATSASKVETEPQTVEESQPQPKQPAQTEEQADVVGITREGLSKVLNLIHVVQFFRDQGHVQEYRQAFDSVPDFESLHEFYVKVFSFSESDKFVRMEDKLNRSLNELESYVNSANQPALRNESYEFLQNVVQKVVETSFFKEHKADVSTRQTRSGAEPSAIGSELKKDHHAEPVVPQEKHRSPEKETKAHEATKVSPAKEGRRDWGSVEDEEEEEREGLDKLREEEQQEVAYEGEGGRAVDENEKPYTSLRDRQNEEEQKQGKPVDDEWATVTAKHKERKDEKPSRGGFGGNKPYRGGRGDGQRKPRPEGERRPPREHGDEQGEEGGSRGGRGGHRGGNRGGSGRGGYQKREGNKDDVYQKKGADATNQPAEGH